MFTRNEKVVNLLEEAGTAAANLPGFLHYCNPESTMSQDHGRGEPSGTSPHHYNMPVSILTMSSHLTVQSLELRRLIAREIGAEEFGTKREPSLHLVKYDLL